MQLAILILGNAFLLFLIQPILGKELLPRWGGGSHVWTTCLMFFQTNLLAGYLYAYLLSRSDSPRRECTIHTSLWALSLLLLPLMLQPPTPLGSATLDNRPTLAIVLDLVLRIGLPFLLLSSTSSLISSWYHRATQSPQPYYWYALSNLSSLLACLFYPTLFEPWMTLQHQKYLWAVGYLLLGISMIATSRKLSTAPAVHSLDLSPSDSTSVSASVPLWTGLAAASSIILSATTSYASQAGVIVPGLWVIPLAIYLGTWWMGFSLPALQTRSAQLFLFYSGAAVGIVLLIFKLWLPWLAIVIGCLAVIACTGLACHGLIYRLRPPPQALAKFYLWIGAGGALGSIFVSWIAPNWFNDLWELHAGLALGGALIGWYHANELFPKISTDPKVRRISWPIAVLCPTLLLGFLATLITIPSLETCIGKKRDFYGVVSVVENDQEELLAMLHGQIRHGTQPLSGDLDPDKTSYYQSNSGAALAFGWCHDKFSRPLKVGVVGLGTGSLSLYAKATDTMVYFEISPAIYEMAREHFAYLKSHSGTTQVLLGDGRMLLQKELASRSDQATRYDLLAIDAFSNDSLPIHLLTLEAIELYKQSITQGGVIAMNITNRNLDLAPVLFATAKQAGLKPLLVESKLHRDQPDSKLVRWLLLFDPSTPLPPWPGARDNLRPSSQTMNPKIWTDDFASPLHALRGF